MSTRPYISLLDAFPGSGKTHLFRSIAFQALTLRTEDNDFVFVYVAPTKALCEEVYNTLTLQIQNLAATQSFPASDVEVILSRIHAVWGNDKGFPPSQQLNFFLGTQQSKLVKPLETRNIIITTHESFVRVKNCPTSKPTWVFFDEARQCLGSEHMVKIPIEVAPTVLAAFSPKEIFAMTDDDVPLDKKVYRLRPANKLKPFSTSSTTAMKSYLDLQEILEVDSVAAGRVSIYILAPEAAVNPKAEKRERSKNRVISIFTFQNPERMFQNYSRITILSAFFKDSQMFHSLSTHYEIVDIMRPDKKKSTYPKWIQRLIDSATHGINNPAERDEQLRLRTGSRLKVVALVHSDFDSPDHQDEDRSAYSALDIPLEKISLNDRLSKYSLTRSMFVSATAQSKVIDYIEKNKLPISSRSLIEIVWLHWYAKQNPKIRDTVVSNWERRFNCAYGDHVPTLFKILKPFMFDEKTGRPMFPAWALTRQARILFKQISSKYHCAEKPLLIYNSKRSNLNYLPVLPITLNGLNLPQSPLVSDTHAFLRRRFEKTFDIPDTPRLNGLNTWQKSDHFVHLAALNPNTEAVSLLRRVLPMYDANYDFMLENLIQTLYRTSLRNPNLPETSPVFLYTSKATVARLLAQRLKLKLDIFNFKEHGIKRPNLVELNFTSSTAEANRRRLIAGSKRKYASKAIADEAARLTTAMHRYINIEKSGAVMTTKQKDRLKELRRQFKALQPDSSL